jgi:acyl-CoA reductase-like NAD-dependent aldehyde dehydrogenase
MTSRVSQLKPGRDVGAMSNAPRLIQLENLVNEAVKQGAKLLVGGKNFVHPDKPEGHYFEPTLLADVTMDMEIAKQECFAPVMLVLKAEVSNFYPSSLPSLCRQDMLIFM